MSCPQLVMEFSDAVMDVDSHAINTSHWKQFSEVSGFNFSVQYHVYFCSRLKIVDSVRAQKCLVVSV